MDQMLGSIAGFFYKQWNVRVYQDETPNEIEVPSMYFPPPNTVGSLHSKDHYNSQYQMNVRIHHTSTRLAVTKADEIAQRIRAMKFRIPLLNSDGTLAVGYLYFRTVDASRVDEDVAQVALIWDVESAFD